MQATLSLPQALQVQHFVAAAAALLAAYAVRNFVTRNARINETEKKYRHKYAVSPDEETARKPRMIHAGLKGVRDAQRISRTALYYDMPFMSFTSLEFALFKTYGIPTISGLLKATGQLAKTENAGRRFVDTSVLISAMTTFPLPPLDLEGEDSQEAGDELVSKDWNDPRAAIAISRMNFLHRRWKSKISRDDLLYTLSLFVLEPPAFIRKYEWRNLTELEEEALFTVWYHIGRCMGIQDIPETRQDLREWADSYEAANMKFHQSNEDVARYTVDLLLYAFPKFTHPYLYTIVIALLNDRLRSAFGFKRSPGWMIASMTPLLRIRAYVAVLFFPAYKKPKTFCPSDAHDLIISGKAAGAFCPATGISSADAEKEGKSCPVGSHAADSKTNGTAAEKGADDLASLARMQPGWIENEPWYTPSAPTGSLRWILETLTLTRSKNRWGAARWQNKTLHDPKAPLGRKAVGFRLEECGPEGLELTGREEVLKEAVQLNGDKPLTGIWAFQPQVKA